MSARTDRPLAGESASVDALADVVHVSAAPARSAERGADVGAAFRAHGAFVWRSVVCLGAPRAHADDLVQEVFLVLHRHAARLDREPNLRGWLYATARHLVLRDRRGRDRRTSRHQGLVAPESPTSPEESLARREAFEAVQEFLSALNPAQREVFALIEIEGLSGPQVAQMLGLDPNTVYSRLRRSRLKFAEFARELSAGGPEQGSKAQ